MSEALTEGWLDHPVAHYQYYSGLRDKYEPNKPIWITETAQAACGGSRWASTFIDTFRYVNQMGLLAQKGVDVIFHNTLAASDYALLEEETFEPRPNYWAAVLWQRLMGTKVLNSPVSPAPTLRIYAHCEKDKPGRVALAAINLDGQSQGLALGAGGEAWTITAKTLTEKTVSVNGITPSFIDGDVRGLASKRIDGTVEIPGHSITYISTPSKNQACR